VTEETRTIMPLVRAAIARVKLANENWRDSQTNPWSNTEQRTAARERLICAQCEFGWQWKNVEAILNELAPEKADANT